MGFGGRAQCGEEHHRLQAIRQRQVAAGEDQHVAHLVLQLVQPLLQAPGETLLLLHRQYLLGEMAGIEQCCGKRRTDLVGQGGDHAPQRGEALVAGQLVLQATGFGEVGEQHQLPGSPFNERVAMDRRRPSFMDISWPSSLRGRSCGR